ncbi:mitochondrial chaperone Frataxin [Biscogniauxia mediterranea]|nr:mitochondrial chaperone Frataxin [Biscogniauxia mediterranea]
MIRTSNIANLGRLATRCMAAHTTRTLALSLRTPNVSASRLPILSQRPISTSSRFAKPLSPEALKTARAVDLSDAEYHELADDYLETLLGKYEAMQDERGDIDVEYSSGVMHIKIPSVGEYVLNKQPPNKQIWLSSPKSGPKRYDYVVISEGQDQKQDTATASWIYLRDGSSLNQILYEETGVDMDTPPVGSVE